MPDTALATTDANVLFRRAMTYPDLREIYLKTLEDCAILSKTDDWLLVEIDRLMAIIFDAALGDTRKQYPNDQFDNAVEYLRDWAAARPNAVLAEVARLRR